jgi:NAD(P)H dehydrogenase (quinone)
VILVTGASGYVGRTALRRLVSMGAEVAAMVRNVERAREHLPDEVPIRVGDYDDLSSLERAFDGMTRLLFVASDGDARDVMRHHANVIQAVAATGIDIVFTSITDIDATSPFYFTPVYRDAEHRLADLGSACTILRCGLYADFILTQWIEPALSTGMITLPVGESLVAPVSRDDVAEAAARLVVTNGHEGMTYEITGPDALSFEEIAAQASRSAGVPIRYVPCAPSDYLVGVWQRLEDPWQHAFSTLCASIAQGRYARVSSGGAKLLGGSPESMEAFLRRTLTPTTEGGGDVRHA